MSRRLIDRHAIDTDGPNPEDVHTCTYSTCDKPINHPGPHRPARFVHLPTGGWCCRYCGLIGNAEFDLAGHPCNPRRRP